MVTVNTEARRDETVKITKSAGPKALRDRDGNAIKRAEPLIDRDTWEKVKQVLADNAERIGPKVDRSPLLHVAYCSSCGSALHLHQANTHKGDGKYRYYVCPGAMRKKGCKARSINAGKLEAGLGKALLTVVGDDPMTESVEEPAVDYSNQIAELAEAIGELASQMAIGRAMGRDISDIQARQQVNEANLMKLAAEPAKPAQTSVRETGETWAACWQRCDWAERNTTCGGRASAWRRPSCPRLPARRSGCPRRMRYLPRSTSDRPSPRTSGDPLDSWWLCSQHRSSMQSIMGVPSSPGRPERSARDQRVARLREMSARMRSRRSEAPSAPSSRGMAPKMPRVSAASPRPGIWR